MTKLYGNRGEKVYRSYSSCISSIGNLIGTPLSSSCQLRLGVDLSRHSLRPYRSYSPNEVYNNSDIWIIISDRWRAVVWEG